MNPPALVDALVDLGRLAMAFGRIDRTAVRHPDGTPESDADHTVMLGWTACALAARCFPGLDLGLVAQFALVHDAVEAYAGDTPTLRIDGSGRAGKAAREAAAAERIGLEFGTELPWFPAMIDRYERQEEPEARYVCGLDKCMPKIVHLLDRCAGLLEFGMGVHELVGVLAAQRDDMAAYVDDFGALMDLRDELASRTVAAMREQVKEVA
jgi:putative hydrolase of HD superfamily